MTHLQFPSLAMEWQATRDTIQTYAKVLGKVRRALTPPHKHWYHVSLRVGATGLITSPIPAGDKTFEMVLDLTTHKVVINTSHGDVWQKPLTGQSAATFCDEALAALAAMGVTPDIDRSLFEDTTPGSYVREQAETYWRAISQLDAVFKQFKGELRKETSPIQLWPHHIDLAMLWFSGRLVPGTDPADEENADEQMNFGFAPGDEGIPEPYFYITAYPLPDGWLETELPADAEWYTASFKGALMKYAALVEADDPGEKLLSFLRTAHASGSALMK